MSGISIKAVAIGVAIDIGGTFLAGVLFTIVYTVVLMSQGVATPADLQHRMQSDQSFYVVSLILGTGFLVGGAFAAARIARAREIAHAGLVGAVAMVMGALIVFVDTSVYPSWYIPVSFGMTPPVALLTGYVARQLAKPR
jgi:hypothetical protein